MSEAYDAMVAAVAIVNGMPLYTCSPDDFSAIEGLVLGAIPAPQTARLD